MRGQFVVCAKHLLLGMLCQSCAMSLLPNGLPVNVSPASGTGDKLMIATVEPHSPLVPLYEHLPRR